MKGNTNMITVKKLSKVEVCRKTLNDENCPKCARGTFWIKEQMFCSEHLHDSCSPEVKCLTYVFSDKIEDRQLRLIETFYPENTHSDLECIEVVLSKQEFDRLEEK